MGKEGRKEEGKKEGGKEGSKEARKEGTKKGGKERWRKGGKKSYFFSSVFHILKAHRMILKMKNHKSLQYSL